jgi:nicotinate-nucleotide pyrophosphorylase
LITQLPLDLKEVEKIINLSLKEDIGKGDITTDSIVNDKLKCVAVIKSKDRGILAGNTVSEVVFKKLDPKITYIQKKKDGDTIIPNDIIAEVRGSVRTVLTGERLSLNFLQRLSGIATLSQKFVNKTKGFDVKILDTRKTTPGLRILEKYAVTVGGCYNHRFGLFDGILIKDNHIKIAGNIEKVVLKVRAKHKNKEIEVEASNFNQVREALKSGADIIMLDNMTPDKIKKAVKFIDSKAMTEASGGINLDNIGEYAKTGTGNQMEEKAQIIAEINRLRKEKNAVILAHNYQIPDVQDIADFVGDSLSLSQEAEKTDADIIVFCGVHFMAETASIISPNKKVLIPDLGAGCSLSDTITADQLRDWKKQHPGAVVVSYVNTTAEVKSESDYCCTSTNAVDVVNSIPEDKEILFLPDMFLGAFVARETGRNINIWPGECHVHADIKGEDIKNATDKHPDAERACNSSRVWLFDFYYV